MMPWPVELGPEFVHGAKSSLKVDDHQYMCVAGYVAYRLSYLTHGCRACWRRSAATCASFSGQTTGTLVQSGAWLAPECRCARSWRRPQPAAVGPCLPVCT